MKYNKSITIQLSKAPGWPGPLQEQVAPSWAKSWVRACLEAYIPLPLAYGITLIIINVKNQSAD